MNRKFVLHISIPLCAFLMISCSSAKIKDNIQEVSKIHSNTGTEEAHKNIKNFKADMNENYSSDCVYEKKYVKTRMSKDLQTLTMTKGGLWRSENAESLTYFPTDKLGFYPDWVAAVEKGVINPLGTLDPAIPEEEEVQEDILLRVSSPLREDVCFPHSVHTYWLSCNNCHPEIFIPKVNANPINMTKIIKGEFCGRCHGKVAFHVSNNCFVCHNTPKK